MSAKLAQNRGIGEAICQSLASTIQEPFVLYAASRKGVDLGIKTSSTIQIKYPKLDISDLDSIQNLVDVVKSEHNGLDVLINNAGVNLDDNYSPENVKITLDTNYRGTLHVSVGSLNGVDCVNTCTDVSSFHTITKETWENCECFLHRVLFESV